MSLTNRTHRLRTYHAANEHVNLARVSAFNPSVMQLSTHLGVLQGRKIGSSGRDIIMSLAGTSFLLQPPYSKVSLDWFKNSRVVGKFGLRYVRQIRMEYAAVVTIKKAKMIPNPTVAVPSLDESVVFAFVLKCSSLHDEEPSPSANSVFTIEFQDSGSDKSSESVPQLLTDEETGVSLS